jgi:biotin carboxyl carrier protein
MKLSTLVSVLRPLLVLAVLAGAGAAAYSTRETWWPYVFPTKPAEKPADEHDHDHGDEEDAPKVKLSAQAQQNLGLVAAEPTPREYWRTMVIPGMVVDRPGESDRRVASRVAGTVTDLKVRLGDSVRPGDPLFTIQLVSELLQTTQADLARAATDLTFAEKERDRIANLVKGGTTPGAELTKQQNAVERLVNQVKAARRQLLALGLTAEQIERAEKGEAVTEVVVRAPGVSASGPDRGEEFEVRQLHVALGDHVMAGQILCQLANHRHLLIEGAAFKSEAKALAALVANRTPVEVEFAEENPGDWPAPRKMVVTHIAEHVDPSTRTFAFYLPLENEEEGGVWRYSPGQRVRLRVPVERLTTRRADGTERDPFVFPAGAVVREGAEAFVFVKVEDIFIRRPVRVLYEDRTEVVVANDGSVTRAETVVRNQAAALNRAIKAAAGGGEGHHHDHEH